MLGVGVGVFVCLSVCLSDCLSVCLSVCVFVCVCINIYTYIIGGASGQGCNSALEDAVDIAQVISLLALMLQKYKY
jgi:hypothetical protein